MRAARGAAAASLLLHTAAQEPDLPCPYCLQPDAREGPRAPPSPRRDPEGPKGRPQALSCETGGRKGKAEGPRPGGGYVRVAGGGDEVYTAVHPRVGDPLLAVDVDLLLQVLLVLVVDELHDGLPAAESHRHEVGFGGGIGTTLSLPPGLRGCLVSCSTP